MKWLVLILGHRKESAVFMIKWNFTSCQTKQVEEPGPMVILFSWIDRNATNLHDIYLIFRPWVLDRESKIRDISMIQSQLVCSLRVSLNRPTWPRCTDASDGPQWWDSFSGLLEAGAFDYVEPSSCHNWSSAICVAIFVLPIQGTFVVCKHEPQWRTNRHLLLACWHIHKPDMKIVLILTLTASTNVHDSFEPTFTCPSHIALVLIQPPSSLSRATVLTM